MRLEACGYIFELVDRAGSPVPPRQPLGRHAAQFGDLPMVAQMYAGASGVDVDLGEFGAFRAGASERDAVEVLRWPADAARRDEFLNGPVLLSTLAARGIYALHASAFRVGGDIRAPTLAVIAPSGTGKSTLARAAWQRGWERLSDDLLPTRVDDDGGVVLLPHFPQLKLPAAEQYPAQRPARVPLVALAVLERADTTTTAPLLPKDVMQTVLSSTISARLFAPAVLQEHWHFAAALAAAAASGHLHTLRLRMRDDRAAPAQAADEALALLSGAVAARRGDR